MKKKTIRKSYYGLITGAITVGILATLLGYSLKKITEFFEEHFLGLVYTWPWWSVVLPSVGITLIYFTRKYLFKGKKNKGIAEIFHTLDHRRDELPFYKVPSHYINGFLTVVFGGSTGIEVSTVVATAALGASARRKESVANSYKAELICAGVAAGITVLFGSPLAGLLFAIEVISRKANRTMLLSCGTAVVPAWGFVYFFDSGRLFDFSVSLWKTEAIPFMILLSILAGIAAVYFTRSVIFIKERFSVIKSDFIRVNLGAILVGAGIFIFPALYGDSYHAVSEWIAHDYMTFSLGLMLTLFCIIILKPLAASLTLGAGGDGGVFAPSIVTGALLGILVAVCCNHYFHTELIPLNFALIGAGAMLSAAIHAPLTALFLTCTLAGGGFNLFIPVLIGVFTARYVAGYLCRYTVYTYNRKKDGISFSLRS
ncbi:chloride channel protein [Sinomicrobium soli]|uniref:chloride channel protein n=1 Tax=Sinomicrobium sp. N-1-3-6 TaxID=2219864 RepID=UPI000DCC3D7E|nr:chloride channel protein [Sinomicrobium sp. N-1-3-6]RAV30015.1 chloride channel protein [Sinomicrobium sp. N-1-3-6]